MAGRLGSTREAAALLGLVMMLGGIAPPAASQQLTEDDAAMMVLNSARRAYNEGKYAFASERFRDFLKQHSGHKTAPDAYYGLALSLMDSPDRDYAGAAKALQQVVGLESHPDRPLALYYMGVAMRGMGRQSLAQAAAKPNEGAPARNAAMQSFSEAGRSFSAAAAVWTKKVAAIPASTQPGAAPPAEAEWAARARCDSFEMLLQTGKFKEAAEAATAFLADPTTSKSQYRPLALYHLGYADFMFKNYLSAGRALSQLAPFGQEFGLHARYMLARVHHLSNERPEAFNQYKEVLAGYEERKKAAQEALKNPQSLKPEQRASLEALVNQPPDYLPRALFYSALLQAEDGRFAEAMERFSGLIQKHPKFPLAAEAQLRLGYCHMQLRNYPEAIKTLQPLRETPQMADQAMWWLAKVKVAVADPNDARGYEQALKGEMDNLRQAAERAGELGKTDPEAKVRRGDILLELADTQQLARQFKEAAATYQQVLADSTYADRAEEAMQRQVTALHLAGMYKESDDLCQKFQGQYPKSTLLPAVLFRAAENAYLTATAAWNNANLPNREQELNRLFGEAITRYQRVVKQFPEFPGVNLARQGLAMSHYRLGRYSEAIPILNAIPEPDRTGEMAIVPYVLADCLIRTLPAEADDAIQAAALVDQAEQAARLLDGFISAQGKNPQPPDALLKLAYCYQRVGAMLAAPAERQKVLNQARETCDKARQLYPKDPCLPMFLLERAKCLALLGDPGGATGELSRFRADPLKSSPVAPLALLRLSALMRSQNRAPEAATLMAECRNDQEATLLKDPARSDWVPSLQYEHALAIKESGKLPEARTLFESVAKQFAGRPEAVNALWRVGQCQREESAGKLAAARAVLGRPGAKPEELSAANAEVEKHLKSIRQAADAFEAQAGELAKKSPGSELHLRMLYELAWCYRVLAESEVEAARQKFQKEAVEKVLGKLEKAGPSTQPLTAPEPPSTAIPVQPMEKAAQERYERLIAASPDAPLANQARFELAEMQARRGDYGAAQELLVTALERNPGPELAERIRVRLACCLLAEGNVKDALNLVQAIAKNPAAPLAAEARYLVAEAYVQQKDWPKATEQLVAFRDQGAFQYRPNVSDRALLRLGHVYSQTQQWDASRQTLEALVGRFGQSHLADEARFGIGRASQAMKQYDRAIPAYLEVVRRSAAEVAARAQLQIGLCWLEQKNPAEAVKALLVVPFTYDYPECSAAAWCHAGQAYLEMKQTGEAAKAWQRTIKDYPQSQWAKLAHERLNQIK